MKKKILMVALALVMVLFVTGCEKCNGVGSYKIIQEVGKGDGVFVFILVRPIAWIMNLFTKICGYKFGWGIVITTIIVRTVAWPVYSKSNDMSLKMNLAQPELSRIQNKYANRQDPVSKQKQQKEMMEIWKKYKINPLGCLLIPFVQMPLFMAMYQVVQRYPVARFINKETGLVEKTSMFADVVDKLKNTFCGIDLTVGVKFSDLNTGEGWLLMIFPILSGITMFLYQFFSQKKPSYVKQLPPNAQNDQQKQTEKTMKIFMNVMVVMMTYFAMQSMALALYWIVGNIYSLAQSVVNRKINEIKYKKLKAESNIIDTILGDDK